jgi:protein-S-isoprenylcysteine O-methyltransferase Ste14
VTPAAAADLLLAAAWLILAVDTLRLAWRRPAGGAESSRSDPARGAARIALLGGVLAGAGLLEQRAGGRLAFHPAAALAGVALAAVGLLLYLRARRRLGDAWQTAVAARRGAHLVTGGPYAVVRHPLYLGVLLLALGTVLAHPSLATLCVAGGLMAGMALKIPAEERALRAAYGDAWLRYAADVPALLPRPGVLRRGWRR